MGTLYIYLFIFLKVLIVCSFFLNMTCKTLFFRNKSINNKKMNAALVRETIGTKKDFCIDFSEILKVFWLISQKFSLRVTEM